SWTSRRDPRSRHLHRAAGARRSAPPGRNAGEPRAARIRVARGDHPGARARRGSPRGGARAHGEILGVLGAWDVLLPGALLSVASEIDPARGRLAVLGGCTLIVEALDTGVEHPAEYPGRFDHLAIWKRGFNPVPLPSLFWHRDVAARIGRLAAGEPFAVGYDLVCRIAAAGYRIQRVSASWSATRLEGARSAARRTEHEMLQEWIAISRRHWGSWLSPLRWRCAGSLWLHRRDRHEHARHHARRSEQAAAEGRALAAAFERMMTWLY